MQLSAWVSVFLVAILVAHVDVVESRGGGGGGGRGSSGGRSSSSSSKSGRRGSSSSYHGGSGGGISTFSTGTGVGSIARSRMFRTAIAGYLTYQVGKAIIRTAGATMMWNNQSYYWGPSYYQNRSGYEMCSMPLTNSTDNTFNDVFFNNGTRPMAIVWGCRSYKEYCCGYECCPSDNDGNSITDLIIGLIVLLVFVYLMYSCIRKTHDSIVPSANNDAKLAEYPVNASGPMYSQAPQQPSYPQPPSYPQQPDPPPPYPS